MGDRLFAAVGVAVVVAAAVGAGLVIALWRAAS